MDRIEQEANRQRILAGLVRHPLDVSTARSARQAEIIQKFLASLVEGKSAGYSIAPTGFGKTRVFGEIVAAAGVRTLIVTERCLLVDQIDQEISANPRIDPATIGRLYGDSKSLEEILLSPRMIRLQLENWMSLIQHS